MKEYGEIKKRVEQYFVESGFIVKDGFKFGSDYILYRSDGKQHVHGFALVLVHNPLSSLPFQQEVLSFIRLADSVNKKAYYAVSSLNEVYISYILTADYNSPIAEQKTFPHS